MVLIRLIPDALADLCHCYWNFHTSNSYTMGCQPVHGDNPQALASGLFYVQVDKHGTTMGTPIKYFIPRTSV